MLNPTIAQLKSDLTPKLKGTSLVSAGNIYSLAGSAANRMLARIDTQETRRTMPLSQPFYDNLLDYNIPVDFKAMIDIKPTQGRQYSRLPGNSDFSLTSAKQFDSNMKSNEFSIQWNSGVRTLRARRLPAGNVSLLDSLTSPTANGQWLGSSDIETTWNESQMWNQSLNWDMGLYTDPLNWVAGGGSLGFNFSGATGTAKITNATASVIDLSSMNYQDASLIFLYIPSGFSARFNSVTVVRGDDASDFVSVIVTTRADGSAFQDGWNQLYVNWNSGTVTGTPTNTQNTYRQISFGYTPGSVIKGVLVNNWTDSLGQLYEIEYYSEYLFRNAAGIWIPAPLEDTDILCVDSASYEIIKTEMMVDITQNIRVGPVRSEELADWRLMLNGQPQSRYIKDPPYHGLYADYLQKFPSSQIPQTTSTYTFDL